MLGFWEALESASAASVMSADPQRSLRESKALSDARAFHDEMVHDEDRLSRLGVEVTRIDDTVSFRKNGYGIVSVHFGSGDGGRNRVVSAVAVHLQRDPAYEDVASDQSIGPTAGRWLGLSIDLIVKNPRVFERFGLI